MARLGGGGGGLQVDHLLGMEEDRAEEEAVDRLEAVLESLPPPPSRLCVLCEERGRPLDRVEDFRDKLEPCRCRELVSPAAALDETEEPARLSLPLPAPLPGETGVSTPAPVLRRPDDGEVERMEAELDTRRIPGLGLPLRDEPVDCRR